METIIINLDSDESLSNIAQYSLTCNVSKSKNRKFFRKWINDIFSYEVSGSRAKHIIFIWNNDIIGFGNVIITSIETYVGDENRMEVSLVYDYNLNINNNSEMKRLMRKKIINQLI